MGLHFWLIPALAILAVVVTLFYLIIRLAGGTGVRDEGRTVIDKPVEEKEPVSGEWNFIEPSHPSEEVTRTH